MGFDSAAALSTSLSAASVSGQIQVGVVRSVDNLDKTLATELFSSLGLGQNVDFHA
jgi:hypothetical protein